MAVRSSAGQLVYSILYLTCFFFYIQACTLAQKYSLNVSPIEESLMEMLHPEGNIDTQWVS